MARGQQPQPIPDTHVPYTIPNWACPSGDSLRVQIYGRQASNHVPTQIMELRGLDCIPARSHNLDRLVVILCARFAMPHPSEGAKQGRESQASTFVFPRENRDGVPDLRKTVRLSREDSARPGTGCVASCVSPRSGKHAHHPRFARIRVECENLCLAGSPVSAACETLEQCCCKCGGRDGEGLPTAHP